MKLLSVVGFLLLMAAPFTHSQEVVPGIPPVLYQAAYERPVWVSESAVSSDTDLLLEALPPGFDEIIRNWADSSECIEIVAHNDAPRADERGTFAEEVRRAERIVSGVIVNKEAGFFQSTPGTLLRLRPQETIFGEHRGDDQFVFIPVGEVRVGEKSVCSKDSRFPFVPGVGGEIVLLVPPHWFNDGEILFIGIDRGFLPIVNDRVALPQRFGTSPTVPRGKRELINWLRDAKSERNGT